MSVAIPLARLADFAAVGDALRGQSSKLAKAATLGEYLRSIEDDRDLLHAVTFSAGRNFPATDARVTGVSSAFFRDAVAEITGVTPEHWRTLSVRHGEAGEALAALFRETAGFGAETTRFPPLSLADLAATFDMLALIGDKRRKRSTLASLFRRCRTDREAAYVGKIVFGDLRTGVAEGVLLDAVARAFGSTSAECRRALLLEGDLAAVAVLARSKRLADARFRLFHPLSFMLAAVVTTPDEAAAQIEARRFVAEDKLDGIRAQLHISHDTGRIELYTRTLDAVTASFPEVVAAAKRLPGELILDGELVPWRGGEGGHALPFAHIQKRLGRKKVSAAVAAANPVVFIAFDLLYQDGTLLLDETLERRRARLEAIAGLHTLPQVVLTGDDSRSQVQRAFDAARARKNEGVILKDLASPYHPGRRGQHWYKLKSHLPTLDCVVTAAEHGHGKRREHLSDYTFAVWTESPQDGGPPHPPTLVNLGKAYSGVTDAEIEQLTKLFTEISTAFDGRVHQVPPRVVLEIAFDAIQISDRHASGFALRFPRIKRVRWDKRPEDADTLPRVREVHDSPDNLNRVDPATAPDAPPPEPPPAREPTLFDGM